MGKHSNHPTIWLTEARKKGRGEKWYVWSYAAAPSRREIVYNVQGGNVDPLKLKRLIISNLADDDYLGHQAYWKTAMDAQK